MVTNTEAERLYRSALRLATATSRGLFTDGSTNDETGLTRDPSWDNGNGHGSNEENVMNPDPGAILVFFIAAVLVCTCCLCLLAL